VAEGRTVRPFDKKIDNPTPPVNNNLDEDSVKNAPVLWMKAFDNKIITFARTPVPHFSYQQVLKPQQDQNY
jgi:hypothetical protein